MMMVTCIIIIIIIHIMGAGTQSSITCIIKHVPSVTLSSSTNVVAQVIVFLGKRTNEIHSIHSTQLPTDSTYYYVLEVVAERRFSPRTPIRVCVLVYHGAVVCTRGDASGGAGNGCASDSQ